MVFVIPSSTRPHAPMMHAALAARFPRSSPLTCTTVAKYPTDSDARLDECTPTQGRDARIHTSGPPPASTKMPRVDPNERLFRLCFTHLKPEGYYGSGCMNIQRIDNATLTLKLPRRV